MRLRNIAGARERIYNGEFTLEEPEKNRGNWNTVFGNNNPIHIEIGMGKGQFIMEMARIHPQINYIGIEKYSSVLLRAVQKMQEELSPPSNVKFIRMDAENMEQIFGKEEIQRIYLNFSDPWPKDRHAKRRLPSKEFLKRYDNILHKDGTLEFKTDNLDLFNFGLEELKPAGWRISQMTRDLHNERQMMEGNVMTEYEQKFSSKGNPIYKYIVER